MNTPHVLVFIDWYRPGSRAGGPVRSLANLIDHLQGRVRFHIVTRDTDYQAIIPYPGVLPDRWTTLSTGERVWYASSAGLGRRAWMGILRERQWDAVYINGIYSWWFSILPLGLLRGAGLRRIVAVRGMLAEGPMRFGRLKKRLFLFLARNLGLYRGVEFHATTPDEAQEIVRWIGKDQVVHVLPNLPRPGRVAGLLPRPKQVGALSLVSVGRIAVEKNTHLALEALRQVRGQVTFDLYGAIYDRNYWQRCLAIIAALPPGVRVVHHGSVDPERVPALLAAHHVFLMPSAGENFGHAMLEALCAGTPLLISDRTPWRGLMEQRAGWDLPLDSTDGFIQVVQQLVEMDQGTFDTWSRAAFELGTRYLAAQDAKEKMIALLSP